jgi:hypothetical protein
MMTCDAEGRVVPFSKNYSINCLKKLRKDKKNISKNSRHRGRESNKTFQDYEAEVLIT